MENGQLTFHKVIKYERGKNVLSILEASTRVVETGPNGTIKTANQAKTGGSMDEMGTGLK